MEFQKKLAFLHNWISEFDPERPDEGFLKTYVNLDLNHLKTDSEILQATQSIQNKIVLNRGNNSTI